MSLEEAEDFFGDFIALFSFGSNRPEVIDNIKHIMMHHTLLAPEVPVCGGEVFNLEYAKKHSAGVTGILIAADTAAVVFVGVFEIKSRDL